MFIQLLPEQEAQMKELRNLQLRVNFFFELLEHATSTDIVESDLRQLEWGIKMYQFKYKELQ